jgi:hypothetical protein
VNQSPTIGELAKALAAAQAEMPKIPMNATNPFLKNRYADLGSVIEASRPILAKHGLAICQMPTLGEHFVGVGTRLLHSSGEWLEDMVLLPLVEEKGLKLGQVAGSIITYLRRYAWSAALGLYADEDTDGGLPTGKPANGQQAHPAAATTPNESKAAPTHRWVIDFECKKLGIDTAGLDSEIRPAKSGKTWLWYFVPIDVHDAAIKNAATPTTKGTIKDAVAEATAKANREPGEDVGDGTGNLDGVLDIGGE